MNDLDEGGLPDLPLTWTRTRLGEIAEVMDTDHKMPKAKDHGIFFISPKDFIDNSEIDFQNAKKISEEDFERISRKCKPETGDLLFSRIGTIGRVRKVPTNLKFHISYSLCIIRPHRLLQQTDFLFHLLKSSLMHEQALSKRRSIGVPDLGLGDIKNFSLPFPPLAEQHRIVARIEELFSRLDAGVVALQKAKAQLQRYRQSVLKAAVEGRLTEEWRKAHPDVEPAEEQLKPISEGISQEYAENALFELPDSWTWSTLGNLIAEGPQNGLYLPQSSYGSGVPILRIDDFQDDCSRSSNQLRLVNASPQDIEKYSLRDGDLVINRVNSPSHLGKCLLVSARNLPAIFESNMMRLQLSQSVDPQFIVTYLRSLFGKRQITINAKWAVNQASINQKDVSNTFVPFPPFPEQQVISERVESFLSVSSQIDRSIDNDLIRTGGLRQSILKRAFQGMLVPQDPNDEPASVLLERIKAERFKGSQRKGGRIKRNNTQQMRLIQ